MDTDIIKQTIDQIDDSTSIEQLSDAMVKLNFIRETERELRAQFTKLMISYIRANGEVTIGTKRYYVGSKKVTKNRDRAGTLKALFIACGGDIEKIQSAGGDIDLVASEFLSADPFRPGACKDALSPAVWSECFEVTTKEEISEGKPVPQLQEIDERFIGRSKGQGKASQE